MSHLRLEIGHDERRQIRRAAAGMATSVAFAQLAFGVVWILLSDRVVASLAHSPEEVSRLQTTKGIFYMALAFAIMFAVVYKIARQMLTHRAARSRAEREVIERLAMAAEWRDDETGGHVKRVSETARIIAEKYGFDSATCIRIKMAAAMHDIGKIGVPDEIVMYSGRFSDEQREQMNRHTTIGGQILRNATGPLMEAARNVALYHHERWDGAGYPDGLKGEEIPVEARITAVADVLDALFSRRRYKDSWPWDLAIQEILSCSGTNFDPKVIDAFVAGMPEIRQIYAVAIRRAEEEDAQGYEWLPLAS